MSSDGYLATEDGVRLYFETVGDGRNCVVVPNGTILGRDLQAIGEGRTLVLYDPRHRGRSDRLTDPARLARGILNDVDDLEAVRRHFRLETMSLIGHSYAGILVGLYARHYPTRAARVVQIAPMALDPRKVYKAALAWSDGVAEEVFASLGRLAPERETLAPDEFCRRFWTILRRLHVVDARDAARADWGRCDLPNERGFLQYWTRVLQPSIESLDLGGLDWTAVHTPLLVVHGRRDRSAPYGAGRDWAGRLPNARLLTVPEAAHAPWIEAPPLVWGALRTFLDGGWPEAAEVVREP